MDSQELVRKNLDRLYRQYSAERKNLTKVRFARILGIGRSLLSRIQSHDIRVGPKVVEKIFKGRISDFEYEEIQLQLKKEDRFLETDQFLENSSEEDRRIVMSDPRHHLLLALCSVQTAKPSLTWYAEKMDCSEATVREIFERFIRLGIYDVEFGSKGEVRTKKFVNHIAGTSFLSEEDYLKRRAMFMQWESSILEMPREEYSCWDLCFPASKKDLVELSQKLQSFVHELARREKRYRGEVYGFQGTIFPLTKRKRPRAKSN